MVAVGPQAQCEAGALIRPLEQRSLEQVVHQTVVKNPHEIEPDMASWGGDIARMGLGCFCIARIGFAVFAQRLLQRIRVCYAPRSMTSRCPHKCQCGERKRRLGGFGDVDSI